MKMARLTPILFTGALLASGLFAQGSSGSDTASPPGNQSGYSASDTNSSGSQGVTDTQSPADQQNRAGSDSATGQSDMNDTNTATHSDSVTGQDSNTIPENRTGGATDMSGRKGSMMSPEMRARREQMMARYREMVSDIKAQDARLNDLMTRLNSATGSDKTDALAEVVRELVAQHRQMHQRMLVMQPLMMRHMANMEMGMRSGMGMGMQPPSDTWRGSGSSHTSGSWRSSSASGNGQASHAVSGQQSKSGKANQWNKSKSKQTRSWNKPVRHKQGQKASRMARGSRSYTGSSASASHNVKARNSFDTFDNRGAMGVNDMPNTSRSQNLYGNGSSGSVGSSPSNATSSGMNNHYMADSDTRNTMDTYKDNTMGAGTSTGSSSYQGSLGYNDMIGMNDIANLFNTTGTPDVISICMCPMINNPGSSGGTTPPGTDNNPVSPPETVTPPGPQAPPDSTVQPDTDDKSGVSPGAGTDSGTETDSNSGTGSSTDSTGSDSGTGTDSSTGGSTGTDSTSGAGSSGSGTETPSP